MSLHSPRPVGIQNFYFAPNMRMNTLGNTLRNTIVLTGRQMPAYIVGRTYKATAGDESAAARPPAQRSGATSAHLAGIRFAGSFLSPSFPAESPEPPAYDAYDATARLVRAAVRQAVRDRDGTALRSLAAGYPGIDVPRLARGYERAWRDRNEADREQAEYHYTRSLRAVACEECDATLRRGTPGTGDWRDGSGDYILPRVGPEVKARERAERKRQAD